MGLEGLEGWDGMGKRGAPLRELRGHAVGVVGRLGFDDLFKTRCGCGRAEPSSVADVGGPS